MKKPIYNISNTTTLKEPPIFAVSSNFKNENYIAFISQGQVRNMCNATLFRQKIETKAIKIIQVFDEVIVALRKDIEYNGFYNAFLLDQLSEEQFSKISEDFAVTFENTLSREMIEKIEILLKYSKERYSPSDLANFFKIEEMVVQKILNDIVAKEFEATKEDSK